jgi:drug/metabolite transporter (DMT)-like permease
MSVIVLYVASVVIWGSSWIMMKFQIGTVPAEASIMYRMAAGSMIMFVWVLARALPWRFSIKDHCFIALQGALIFSLNYFLFYLATFHLTTGLIAVVMSSASVITMLVSTVLRRHMPPPRVALGALIGIIGIGIIFWPQLANFSLEGGASIGLLCAVGGTTCFALGGMVAARNQGAGLSIRGTTAWAMAYGVLLLGIILLARGNSLDFDMRGPYVASLLYLTVFATIIAFACYFALLARIGAERSAYVTVLFPIVALTLSTLFEGYDWTLAALAGVALTLVGNVLVLMRPAATEASKLL